MRRALARKCNICLFCKYARKNPDTLIGKIIIWHGSWCPAWKAWERYYGGGAEVQVVVKETEPVTAAFTRMKGPYIQVGEALGKLYDWMRQKGYQPAGPPLGIYFNASAQVPSEELAWELLIPVAREISPFDPDEQCVGVRKLAVIQVASATYKGPYEGLGKLHEGLADWIKDNGYKISGPIQVVYLNNPVETSPEELLTEIRFPISGQIEHP